MDIETLSEHKLLLDMVIKLIENYMQRLKPSKLCQDIKYGNYSISKGIHTKYSRTEEMILHVTKVNEKINLHLDDIIKQLQIFPNHSEMEGAVNGLFLVHETYHLNWTKYALDNIIISSLTSKPISCKFKLYPKDFEVIGKIAYKRNLYQQSYEFFKTAQVLSRHHNDPEYSIAIEKLLKLVANSQNDESVQSPQTWSKSTYMFPNEKDPVSKYDSIAFSQPDKVSQLFNRFISAQQKDKQFQQLCRGEAIRQAGHNKPLRCFGFHKSDPYLILGPFWIEELNKTPYLCVFHDFLHSKEIDVFVGNTKDQLYRSEHFDAFNSEAKTFYRTSKQTFLEEAPNSPPEVRQLSRRIGIATGLKTNSWPLENSEDFQVCYVLLPMLYFK